MSIVSMDVTTPAASPAGPARKTLFRSSSKSGAGVHTRTIPSSSAVPDVYESLRPHIAYNIVIKHDCASVL